jgi:hypothetical protein
MAERGRNLIVLHQYYVMGAAELPTSKQNLKDSDNDVYHQNHWVSGLCPSSGILNTRKYNISEIGSVVVLR